MVHPPAEPTTRAAGRRRVKGIPPVTREYGHWGPISYAPAPWGIRAGGCNPALIWRLNKNYGAWGWRNTTNDFFSARD